MRTLPCRRASAHAYGAAGRLLLCRADLLVAVWAGRRGRPGGTADTVAAARAAGLPVTILRPGGPAAADARSAAGRVPGAAGASGGGGSGGSAPGVRGERPARTGPRGRRGRVPPCAPVCPCGRSRSGPYRSGP
ncbi:hypothetical protein GCM10010286_58210 [Streptomyces toxytricini]|nr:hypothetical protein GCM10010286_58210 [Streptomyces toxytricini]